MKVVKKEKLIRDVAKQTNNNISDVKLVYNTLENVIFKYLSSVNKDEDICIKLFEGVTLDGKYVPEKVKKNNFEKSKSRNLAGIETLLVKSKIEPKFNITRSYCEKLNNR